LTASARPAILLDRDGVINELVPDPATGTPESPYRPEDVRLVDGAPEALGRLRRDGWVLVVISNQPAAAKGIVELTALRQVHERLEELLREAGSPVDAYRYCLHHPAGVTAGLSGPCLCRKPAPGLALAAAFELGLDLAASWVVGDADTDIEAGRAAGCRTALVEHRGSSHRRSSGVIPDLRGPSLNAIADSLPSVRFI